MTCGKRLALYHRTSSIATWRAPWNPNWPFPSMTGLDSFAAEGATADGHVVAAAAAVSGIRCSLETLRPTSQTRGIWLSMARRRERRESAGVEVTAHRKHLHGAAGTFLAGPA